MRTQPQAKRILIYGDSLTYGLIPASGGKRYDTATRFTGQLQTVLGDEYDIIEEWQRGRMLVWENAFFPQRNGQFVFGPIFSSHLPVDMIVLFLGTNDMNAWQMRTYEEMLEWVRNYVTQIHWRCEHLGWDIPRVALVVPPCIDEEKMGAAFGDKFLGAEKKSHMLYEWYSRISEELGLQCIDTSHAVQPGEDGIHLDENNNHILAQIIARAILAGS